MPPFILLILPYLRRFWPYAGIAVLSLLCWHFQSRAVANADAVRTQAAQFKDAQKAAQIIAQEALHHQEAVYQAKAKDADNAYQVSLAAAQSAADRYIALHRVRPATAAGDAGATVASAEGHAPEGGNGPGAAPDMVAVTAGDIQVCTVNTQRLEAVRDWALGL